ncbi:MAG: hypothetical protein WBW33_36355 [Bryobacteraceae bacterium]
MKRISGWTFRLLLAAMLAVASAWAAVGTPRVTFTKSFPGSVPAYVSIAVDKTGNFEYKEAPDDDRPLTSTLTPADAAKLFSLAEQLGFFKSQLESGLKVANTGKKTFRYEPETGAATEAVFNYSVEVPAQQLLALFERISSTEQAWGYLDRTVHFDHLGVNQALSLVESLWIDKELVTPQQFLPLLTRITKQESIMHLARDRAARLKDEFEAANPPEAKPDAKGAGENGTDAKNPQAKNQ